MSHLQSCLLKVAAATVQTGEYGSILRINQGDQCTTSSKIHIFQPRKKYNKSTYHHATQLTAIQRQTIEHHSALLQAVLELARPDQSVGVAKSVTNSPHAAAK